MSLEFDREIEMGKVLFKLKDNVLVSEVNHYITVGPNQVDALAEVSGKYISGNFGFISTRKADAEISIDPMVWRRVFNKVPNLKAFALVTDKASMVDGFYAHEKPFIEEFGPAGFPAEAFTTLEQAHQWILRQLQ